jgi:hypothetical protein
MKPEYRLPAIAMIVGALVGVAVGVVLSELMGAGILALAWKAMTGSGG